MPVGWGRLPGVCTATKPPSQVREALWKPGILGTTLLWKSAEVVAPATHSSMTMD